MMSVQTQPAGPDVDFFSTKPNATPVTTTTTVTVRRRLVSKPAHTSSPAAGPSRSSSISSSPFSSPLSSPPLSSHTLPAKEKRKTKRKTPEALEVPKTRPSKKIRVEKPLKRASNANSRASSCSTSNLASSPLEPIYRSRSSRSRSTSTFPSTLSLPLVSPRNCASTETGDPGPSHLSSEKVVRNLLRKSYTTYFSNPNDPDDKSFEPHETNYPVVELEYPNDAASERFILLAPKDKDHYSPIMDLEKTLYTIVEHYLTPSQRAQIGTVPNDLLSEAFSPPPSPSPSPPNSKGSASSSASLSSLTSLESLSDEAPPRPRINYCRAVQRAINTRDGPLLVKTIAEINKIFRTFKYPDLDADLFKEVSPNSLRNHIQTWTYNGGLPQKVLMRIIDENYQRCVGPNIAKLRKYEAFSSKVYGELMPSLVQEILALTKLNQDSLFMDLGSGVGNVVVQAALQTGCRSYGIELVPGPAQVAREMVEQFKIRCRMWGVTCGEIELDEGDMLESARVAELLPKADVVLVDNKVFEESLNEALRPKFLDLKEGAVVISLKPFVSSLNGLNARVTERNVDDISAIFDVTERPYYPGAVSWGNGGGTYYIHRVDRTGYAEIRRKFENTTRGRRNASSSKYHPSRNLDESDWFGQ
ncbi:DOT1-domain-containing protein [Gymnopus androsaceus JB14]|uniref:Histone-lysine N-methyltransferase, H3 lysine-79 specific n=1 Tax=Gymnopus androsaceus JB14 TaxID=1447944 RepID=A0A6A4HIP4_9AGAR|nr:DOT1-domain-containing protein [Gymnopus androsaceus JB14]